jgi:hypothetical protein
MSEMGRSDRVRGRRLGFDAVGAGTGSMITDGSSIESGTVAAAFCTTPANRLPPFLSDPEDDELAILALLPVAVTAAKGSVIDLALSRLAFCRNLGSFGGLTWPCCCCGYCWVEVGIGVDAEGVILDFGVLLLLELAVDESSFEAFHVSDLQNEDRDHK